jgi:hypothetical protein
MRLELGGYAFQRRPTALRAVATGKRGAQMRLEHLAIHHTGRSIKIVADVAGAAAQRCQIFLAIT